MRSSWAYSSDYNFDADFEEIAEIPRDLRDAKLLDDTSFRKGQRKTSLQKQAAEAVEGSAPRQPPKKKPKANQASASKKGGAKIKAPAKPKKKVAQKVKFCHDCMINAEECL